MSDSLGEYKRDKVSREAHARLWEDNARLRRELAQANETIARLHKQHVNNGVPLEPTTSIGVVQCPKCGQYMEVMK